MINEFETTGAQKFKVLHLPETDGGGTWFGQEYITMLKQRYPGRQFDRCWEWCAGPGFIGFNLLDHGICNQLFLSDIYDPAVELAKETARRAGITDRVHALLFRDLAILPLDYQFDLIVANPPHEPNGTPVIHTADHGGRIEADPGWASHKNFFEHVADHLTEDGVIILQENQLCSTVKDFEPMIKDAGLFMRAWWRSPEFFHSEQQCQIYYIEIAHAR
jgi:methylase of polypeptide subunit release factors